MPNGYQTLIAALLPEQFAMLDPRHIEAYLRLRHGTLDHLTRSEFKRQVKALAKIVNQDLTAAEDLAKSYGL